MNIRRGLLTMGVAVSMTMATGMWAQQTNTGSGQNMQMQHEPGMQMKDGQMQPGQKMSMDSMMQSCHKHMDAMMASNAQTTKVIEAAKQSNDPAQMRAALDEAEKALSPMNKHAVACRNMMNMMKNMQGNSGMMGSGA
jgi:hypothetical protein